MADHSSCPGAKRLETSGELPQFGLREVHCATLRCQECGEWIEVTRVGCVLIAQEGLSDSQIQTVYFYDQGCTQRAGAGRPETETSSDSIQKRNAPEPRSRSRRSKRGLGEPRRAARPALAA